MLKKKRLDKIPQCCEKTVPEYYLIDTSPESQMYIKALGDILVKE